MDKIHFEAFDQPSEDPVCRAYTHFEKQQLHFYSAAYDWTQEPSAQRVDLMAAAIDSAEVALHETVEVVCLAHELTSRERANILATTLVNADDIQVRSFKVLAPTGDFVKAPVTIASLADELEELFDDDMPLSKLSPQIVESYLKGFHIDLKTFFSTLDTQEPSERRHTMSMISEHIIDIAKISTGAVIGSFIVRHLLRKPTN